ncbi:uncharacterized protein SPPG_02758 [Spizellomyces punctatus DAOM BR117]|uniref:DUF6919 domain-containing protein n=1 Tax=Spizellomyces punctatus (strain DAOM BR117) TaxID=645134 RepID=A0A0L0HMX7_SPIPD|nr:uncharacterized protein SPPG_02758 [Spizellomyces punctatus DAOM BR117]KND02280.1 hypothetical protein SPPG_02758 [Spizellomyces punctatus DAOM BR117]|eukprot:XP_016610319.1 hypothetical protein SPPG_02758 [Spizellomyces punctatus DAOM BR117]
MANATSTATSQSSRPSLITYPWSSITRFEDLSKAVSHYLNHRAILTSGRPNSLAKESDDIVDSLIELNRLGFITVSSQPGVKEEKVWQRFYVTGLLPKSAFPDVLESLHSGDFITLLSTCDTTTIHLHSRIPSPPSSAPSSRSPDNTEIPVIPLTVLRHGPPASYTWRAVTDIPLPSSFESLMEGAEPGSATEVVMEDEGSLFEHHVEVSFGRLGLKKAFLRKLREDAVVVTAIWPDWGQTEEPMKRLIESCRQINMGLV